MKKLLLTLTILTLTCSLWAQQDPLYTQYRNNMLSVNPAYAGSREALTVNLLHRSQWVGMEGAPTTQTLTVHGPLVNQNLGFGLSLVHDRIGPTRQTGIYGDLSARVRVSDKGYLAGGLKLGANFFNSNLSGLILTNSTDGTFSENVNTVMPNMGLGLYYYTPAFFAGVSVPKLFKNSLYENEGVDGPISEKQHLFVTTGAVLEISPLLKFKPAVLARMVSGSPFSMDVSGSFILDDRFWVGGYYRLKESAGLLLDYNFNPQLKVCYSYDYALTELQNYNSGSHEISITYDFIFKEKRIQSPRYF